MVVSHSNCLVSHLQRLLCTQHPQKGDFLIDHIYRALCVHLRLYLGDDLDQTTAMTLELDATILVHGTDLEPCKKPACTGADMQTTQDSLSSSKAPPATALDCWLPPGDAAKGFG